MYLGPSSSQVLRPPNTYRIGSFIESRRSLWVLGFTFRSRVCRELTRPKSQTANFHLRPTHPEKTSGQITWILPFAEAWQIHGGTAGVGEVGGRTAQPMNMFCVCVFLLFLSCWLQRGSISLLDIFLFSFSPGGEKAKGRIGRVPRFAQANAQLCFASGIQIAPWLSDRPLGYETAAQAKQLSVPHFLSSWT